VISRFDVRCMVVDISKDRSVLETPGTARTTTCVFRNIDLRDLSVTNK